MMMCAVCFRICDHEEGRGYVHAETTVGLGDHQAVPIAYDPSKAKVLCDFCRKEVPGDNSWIVPVSSFVVAAMIDNQTMRFDLDGNWSACPDCALHVSANDWESIKDDILAALGTDRNDELVSYIQGEIIAGLRDNILGPVRRFRPGDEFPTDV